ncbi:AraC family transcriptional regulator [Chitinophaga silvatica]|uniref:AraC family transcriptional regulator n=1 Tax=Chitinophaga silvatica TaxID=2282649 RepID=A0A3E1Y6X1_9BACT|nr:helix-turn-helix domain-containing protein [Chitinophaga silvatica]RFS20679.1 AraC family transcriptional regulator [Chitinophaga silvatica]
MVDTYLAYPAPQLKDYIKCYTLREIECRDNPIIKPLWANDTSFLAFWLKKEPVAYYRNDERIAVNMEARPLFGVHTQYGGYQVFGGSYKFVGVEFKDNGCYSLFKVPMQYLRNQLLNSDDVIGKEIRFLEEAFSECYNMQRIKEVADKFFIQQLYRTTHKDVENRITEACKILKHQQFSSIREIADALNMSMRSFEIQFLNQIGMSPIAYARLKRFQRAINCKIKDPSSSWTSIAHHCNYFDQNHFIKDFKIYTGDSPSKLFQNQPPPTENIIRLV